MSRVMTPRQKVLAIVSSRYPISRDSLRTALNTNRGDLVVNKADFKALLASMRRSDDIEYALVGDVTFIVPRGQALCDGILKLRIKGGSRKAGECVVWQGRFSTNGQPILTHGLGNTTAVRRESVRLATGRKMTPGEVAIVTCDRPECIAAGHLQIVSTNHNRIGKPMSAIHKARISRARISRSPITQEHIDYALASQDSASKVAAVIGCSKSYVVRLRAGRARKPIQRAGFFTGLIQSGASA